MIALPTLPLPNGQSIPVIGFGTFRLIGDACVQAVTAALAVGYRHIDTAAFYDNHRAVGKAIAASRIPRQKLFVTTKVWRDHLAADAVQRECRKALDELGLDYLDLYLVHWPNNAIPIAETLRGMGALLDAGLIRNFGVSNFTVARLQQALKTGGKPIAANQVEYHPYLNQERLRAFCREQRIALTAYCPLARGEVADDPLLQEIGRRIGKTPAQVALRWMIEKDIVVIPKATAPERIAENFAVLDWKLPPADFAAIEGRAISKRLVAWDVAEFD